jgi:uncharacterized protein (TIRG00374 family)
LPVIVQQVRGPILIGAVFLAFVNLTIRAYRWKIIVNKDEQQLSLWEATIITLIGIALNIVIPATLGDIMKSYYGYKMYGIREEILSASIVDKILALCGLFLLGTISGLLMSYYLFSLFSCCAAVMSFLMIAFPRIFPWKGVNLILRIFKKSLDVEKLLKAYTLSTTLTLCLLGISVGGWLFTALGFYVVCIAFPVQISLGYCILLIPMLTVARLFPFTINSLGVREVTLIYFLGLIEINPTVAVLISLLSNILSTLIPGSVGLLLIFTLGKRIKHQALK